MKKFMIFAAAFLILATVGFVVVASVYLKPIVKNVIQSQLAAQGYENATIGDISVGLYESSISNIDLNNPEQTTIEKLSLTYWPQQLLDKRVATITIEKAKIDAKIRANGDIIVAGYELKGLLTPKENKQGFNLQAVNNSHVKEASIQLIKSAHAQEANTENEASAALPFDNVVLDGVAFSVQSPKSKAVKGIISADYDHSAQSVDGNLKLDPTDPSALYELAQIFKPDLAGMVSNLQGTVSADMDFAVDNLQQLDVIEGDGTVTLTNVGLDKDDIQLRGINGDIEVTNIMPFSTASKQTLTARSAKKSYVNISDFNFTGQIENNTQINVNNARLNAAGGTISTNTFDLNLNNINTDLILNVKSVQFQALAELLNITTGLNLGGTLNADVPISIRNGKIVVSEATINSILQSVGGNRLREKADELIQKNLGDKLDKFVPKNQDGSQQKSPNVRDVIDGFMGGF